MGDLFKHIFDLVFVKTKNNVQKIFYILLIAALAVIINDHFSFTKNLRLNSRLSQLEKLKTITPATFDSDTLIQQEIAAVKQEVFDKSTFTQRARAWITRQVQGIQTARGISATFILLLVMVLLPFVSATRKHFKKNPLEWLVMLLLFELMAAVWALALFRIQAIFPTFRPIFINHVINVTIQFASVILISRISEEKKEKVTVKDALMEEYLRRRAMENMMYSTQPDSGEDKKKEE